MLGGGETLAGIVEPARQFFRPQIILQSFFTSLQRCKKVTEGTRTIPGKWTYGSKELCDRFSTLKLFPKLLPHAAVSQVVIEYTFVEEKKRVLSISAPARCKSKWSHPIKEFQNVLVFALLGNTVVCLLTQSMNVPAIRWPRRSSSSTSISKCRSRTKNRIHIPSDQKSQLSSKKCCGANITSDSRYLGMRDSTALPVGIIDITSSGAQCPDVIVPM